MQPPVASVREQGPWTHQNVSAAGASFHVATAGEGPHTVLLLHDFPQYWWQWREQIPAIAQAGYRAVAMDLRGFGGSDFQPGSVRLSRLATDVSGTIQSLGITSYTLVGAGMGGTVGWMVAAAGDRNLRSLVAVGSPHPAAHRVGGASRSRFWTKPRHGPGRLQTGELVEKVLTEWAAAENRDLMRRLTKVYAAPMERQFAAESAWETLRGTRKLHSAEIKLLATPVEIPVWSVRGSKDPHCTAKDLADQQRFVTQTVEHREVPGSGHFVSEEQPDALTQILLEHLAV